MVLLTLPFDMRDWDAVPLVIREPETLPFVILLPPPPPPPPPTVGAIIRLPSPVPRSSSGKMWISVARSDPSGCFTVVTPMKDPSLTCDRSLGARVYNRNGCVIVTVTLPVSDLMTS
ncbi:MAG TPA: hypothetical protein VJV97_10685 [Gemmatimonadaceae bacterium]|nr:hypothetical protein [Gemmatimonadaceae bacterium]